MGEKSRVTGTEVKPLSFMLISSKGTNVDF